VPAAASPAIAIAGGLAHSLAVTPGGKVVAWGRDSGNGVVSIAAGRSFALAAKSDGTVVGWGQTDSDGAVPAPATLGSHVYAIASGYYQ
jgi:alpha-tubulin suppressor-like RCC1 family protein